MIAVKFNIHLIDYFIFPDESYNNMVSFLSNQEKSGEHDVFRSTINIVTIVTIINLVVSYIAIRIYLKFKHSKSINIAERANFNVNESFISFPKLIFAFLVLAGSGYFVFEVNARNAFVDINNVPPGNLLINFTTLFTAWMFVATKDSVLAFIKRRFTALIAAQNINCLKNQNTVETTVGRRRAWE